jgi:hypothetical protein
MRRHDQIPVPKIKGWKKELHPTYSISRCILEQGIKYSGMGIEEIRVKMGAGVHKIEDALNGHKMSAYDVGFIEVGLGIYKPVDVFSADKSI